MTRGFVDWLNIFTDDERPCPTTEDKAVRILRALDIPLYAATVDDLKAALEAVEELACLKAQGVTVRGQE